MRELETLFKSRFGASYTSWVLECEPPFYNQGIAFTAKEIQLWNNTHCEGKQVNLSFNDLGTEFSEKACAVKQMLIYVFLFYLSLFPSNFKSHYVKNPG